MYVLGEGLSERGEREAGIARCEGSAYVWRRRAHQEI